MGPSEATVKTILKRCPACGWAYLYIQKDFNKPLGCSILVLGAILSPFTYGASMAFCALLDWWLYKRLRYVTVCYICGERFPDAAINPEHEEFDLALDEGYERIREEWREKQKGEAS